MALTTCRECGRQISDQAETCPNCGIRNPASDLGQAPLDDVLYSASSVIVTRTLAKFPNQTFPINGIGSVSLSEEAKPTGCFAAIAIIAAIIAIACLSTDGGAAAFFGFIAIVFFFGMWNYKPKSHLTIKTASGDVRAMSGKDRETMEHIKNAIERAAVLRG